MYDTSLLRDILHVNDEEYEREKKREYYVLFYHYHSFQTYYVSAMLFNNIRTREKRDVKKKGICNACSYVCVCIHIGDVLRMSLTCFAFRFKAPRCPYDYSLNLSSYKNRQNENY